MPAPFRCLVVGKVAIVPNMLSGAVDVPDGESVRNIFVLRDFRYAAFVAAVRGVAVHVAFRVEAAADRPPRFGPGECAFGCSGP